MPIAHKTLIEIKNMAKGSPILIVAIMRQGKSIPPTGDQQIIPGDKIMAIMPKGSFKTFCSFTNSKTTKLKKIVVSGDSLTAVHLAESLKPFSEQVLLLDLDPEHAQVAASTLEGVTVYNADATDSATLQEINIDGFADIIVRADSQSFQLV